MLTRDQILSASKELPSEPVSVPEWGGSVHVRTMTAGERDRFEVLTGDSNRKNFRATLAVFAVCDEDGKRLFSEADIPELGQLPFKGLQRACEVALRLNKISDEAVKDIEGNSDASPSPAS